MGVTVILSWSCLLTGQTEGLQAWTEKDKDTKTVLQMKTCGERFTDLGKLNLIMVIWL